MTIGLVVIALLAICIFYFVVTQRALVKYDEMATNSLHQISVQLSSRWDAVIALVKMTKNYTTYEHDTLLEVINLRRISNAKTPEQVKEQENFIGQVMGRLMAVAEAYPELKAAELYQSTMNSIKEYEENVRLSRMVYNDSVTRINRMVRQMPSSVVASMLHMGLRDYLDVEREKQGYPDIDRLLK